MEPRFISFDASPYLRVYSDGSVERLPPPDDVPPGNSPDGEVASKDVILDDNTGVYVRIYLPRGLDKTHKIPLVVYLHGGGFCIQSPATARYHDYLNLLAKQANVICVSVNFRNAPEHRLPAAYDDCFSVLEWLETGLDPWIESHADLAACFVAGDSGGGNIVHHVGTRHKEWKRLRLVGGILVHPFFGGQEMIGCERSSENEGLVKRCDDIWKLVLPDGANKDHPFCNPLAHGSATFSNLVYSRIAVFVAEKEIYKERHVCYYEALNKAGKDAELIETKGENHDFHLYTPHSENAPLMMKQICYFIHSSSSVIKKVQLPSIAKK
ncbi:hypothetical protein KI387_032974 [Taxus chinensis]|uniref:Alpha/beta hydrolase fold-3 domain-containing protein n=1 Tax=Taxus chinensis TaxID=29808 RepID=A0AA38BTE4_TAXCH|nr:hypothetical protein KI387_032974 [Taxus chinensis]